MSTQQNVYARVTHRFTASAERVFDAWLDPSKARKWFAPELGPMTRVAIDARVGGKFELTQRRDGEDVEHTGTYLELIRPTRLVFTWKVPKYSADDSKVTIDIKPLGKGCELTLTHEFGAEYAAYIEGSEKAWRAMCGEIEELLR